MTTEEILLGSALILALAVGSQVLASRLRIPALIVLLPAGFGAGALTDVVNPEQLLGTAFQPLVSLSVAVILYDAALSLDLQRLRGHTRRVVTRLIAFGVTFTWVSAALLAVWLLGMSRPAGLMVGAILVVSGPTVVGPLLSFVRPTDRLQRVLSWEGSLIDPVGGILGALVFHGVITSSQPTVGSAVGNFVASVGVGMIGGALGVGVLWLALRKLHLAEALGTLTQLAVVIAIAAVCDIVRDDSGLIAAIVMGLALANVSSFDVPARRPFFETLVQLILGLLFISISATVTPASLRHLVLPTLAVVVVLVVLVRPVVAYVSTLRTDLSAGERAFVGALAPRGIVAAATASTFAPSLVDQQISGAAKILPVTFLVIVMTVTLYGLAAAPAARILHVTRPAVSRPLLVGGEPWAIDIGRALHGAGLEVLMWAGPAHQREAIRGAGIELAPGELINNATEPGAQIEGVNAVLLLTGEDDFNELAATLLEGRVEGPVYRLGPPPDSREVLAADDGTVLFGPGLTRDRLAARHHRGSRIVTRPSGDTVGAGYRLLFRVHRDGRLRPVTTAEHPPAEDGDTLVLLEPEAAESTASPRVP